MSTQVSQASYKLSHLFSFAANWFGNSKSFQQDLLQMHSLIFNYKTSPLVQACSLRFHCYTLFVQVDCHTVSTSGGIAFSLSLFFLRILVVSYLPVLTWLPSIPCTSMLPKIVNRKLTQRLLAASFPPPPTSTCHPIWICLPFIGSASQYNY